ncbi:CTD small phosphatase-like protein 2 [Nowakowskiella sp. JEL0078]|nr:CTD small phosphatase-like protein 2 [Nowakowskiella sp. JEL0078]
MSYLKVRSTRKETDENLNNEAISEKKFATRKRKKLCNANIDVKTKRKRPLSKKSKLKSHVEIRKTTIVERNNKTRNLMMKLNGNSDVFGENLKTVNDMESTCEKLQVQIEFDAENEKENTEIRTIVGPESQAFVIELREFENFKFEIRNAETNEEENTLSSYIQNQQKEQINRLFAEIDADPSPQLNLITSSTQNTADTVKLSESSDTDSDEDFDSLDFIRKLPPRIPSTQPPLLPKSELPSRITLILDLDETLVHCCSAPMPGPPHDVLFPVDYDNMSFKVAGRLRPASMKAYADKLLNLIDPKNEFIHHRLFRDECSFVEGIYLKDLTLLGRDLSKTIIIDNSVYAYAYQLDNGIPITSWFDDKNDKELMAVWGFLKSIFECDDVRPVLRNTFKVSDKVWSGVNPTLIELSEL